MRYALEPKYMRYVQGYGFLLFARKFGDKFGKKLMNTATKTGINAAKNQKSLGKSKIKQKENEINEVEEIYIPPEKRQQIIDDLRLF